MSTTRLAPAILRSRPRVLPSSLSCVNASRSFSSSLRRSEFFANANQETFDAAVAKKDKVTLVDFYANWCVPCKQLSPVLEELEQSGVKTGSGKAFDLLTVDTDVETDLAMTYKIRSLPTVIAFVDGKPVQQFSGAIPKVGVEDFLKHL